MVDPIIPATILEAKRSQIEDASPKMNNEIPEPKRLMRSIGLRPYRSLSLPQIGVKMNCIRLYEVKRRPNVNSLAPRLWA
jgi:hypothetical protein